ncbi:myocyte-specific enhancer factor 2A-like isoform X2 [Liolophura sinensis]|uniref:myocyte-specific enhancer factor 2A-like isoform X2 n=1 Tax=Liolophura sinensis TaxID=3198878 RepID=UPI0031594B1C
MGRKKIQISRIGDERNRQVTFTKRKFGLMKKAYELSVLCDCEIALIIFNSANKLFQYASTDMDKVLLKYTEYNEPHESRTNKDIIEALNKKEHKGCESPEEQDQDTFNLTPRTEEKYERINQEFSKVMTSRVPLQMSPYHNPSMPVTVPVHQHSPYSTQAAGSPHPHPSHQQHPHPITTQSSGLLHPSQAIPQSVSPRPSSGGGMVDLTTNGYQSQQRASPASPSMHKSRQQVPSPCPSPGRPNLRVMIPNNRGDVGNTEVQGRQANIPLATPVVSVATPSIPVSSNYPSALPSGFHPNDFQLNTGDLAGLHGFNSPGILPPHWTAQTPLSAAVQAAGITGPGIVTSSAGQMAALNVSTLNNGISIKSEPISPPRDSHTPNQLRPPSSGGGHLSPGHVSHSSNSSPTGSTHNDYDGPSGKRPRLEGWAT